MQHPPLWRKLQKENFTNLQKLVEFLQICPTSLLAQPKFPLNVPRRLAEKMQKGTLEDPLFKQFVPQNDEMSIRASDFLDPVSDQDFKLTERLLKKYPRRALLMPTSSCAMHCRYCFRKNYPYEKSGGSFETELRLLKEDTSIYEVILSGGDPLSLSDHVLESLMEGLEAIPHIKLLRFHTRFPVGIPERIDASFLELLKNCRMQIVFIIHCNHPHELDEDVLKALKKVQCLGIPVLNQSVLLKGVNDSQDVLQTLFEKLIFHGIMPYYLHQLDPVTGSSHFEVDQDTGKALIASLRDSMPGYGIPHYVKEIPHRNSKTVTSD